MIFDMKDAISRLKKSLTQPEISPVSSSRSLSTQNSINANNFSNDFDDDLLPSVVLNGYLPTTKNRLLNSEMCGEIRMLMPTRIQLYTDWTLLYSLEQHGSSLSSLYECISPESTTPVRVGYVIIIKDRMNGIFGAYSNEPFHPTDSRRYYGNGECFLWKLENVPSVQIGKCSQPKENAVDCEWQFRGYPYTGLNQFAIYCTSKFLSMGGGDGHYGLWCDDSLLKGVSDPSLTYGNDILSPEGNKFHIVGLEVWRVG